MVPVEDDLLKELESSDDESDVPLQEKPQTGKRPADSQVVQEAPQEVQGGANKRAKAAGGGGAGGRGVARKGGRR